MNTPSNEVLVGSSYSASAWSSLAAVWKPPSCTLVWCGPHAARCCLAAPQRHIRRFMPTDQPCMPAAGADDAVPG